MLHEFLLVRVGLLGQVGRFHATETSRFRRQDRVVCRTARGIEVGEVLGGHRANPQKPGATDGRIIRSMRSDDELLWGYLRQLSQEAHAACEEWLKARGVATLLLDVEPLLDGKTLYFHFLAGVEEMVEEYVEELAQVYEREVSNSEFAGLVEHGCGPGCGTEHAENGCSKRGGCAVCSIARACRRE